MAREALFPRMSFLFLQGIYQQWPDGQMMKRNENLEGWIQLSNIKRTRKDKENGGMYENKGNVRNLHFLGNNIGDWGGLEKEV